MRLAIKNFIFRIGIFVCWFVPSITNNHFAIENYVDKSLILCENDTIFLNFSNAGISNIGQNFISSSVITCLNLMDNNIENIERNAFNKVPNLTQLFLSNNKLRSQDLFSFGSLNKLQILIMNSASRNKYSCKYYGNLDVVSIFGEYANLEALFLGQNCFRDFQFYREEISPSELAYTTAPIITQRVNLFPKLKMLDLSENGMKNTNFLKMLPNSLFFLDLHDNSLSSLELNEILDELFILNLNNNRFNYISNWHNQYSESLSVAGLKNLRYLYISGNEINVIESGAFRNNNELLYLNLSANNINYLHSKTFANLYYLQILDLSNNKLENVPQVSNETKINTLYINFNKIRKITSHAFMQMPKLTTLLMGQNLIDEIDVNAFINLSVLKELDLSLNKLSSLPEGWAKPLVSLKYLDLSKNMFTSLESLSIPNALPDIKILYLMDDPLQDLNVRYFENLSKNLTINLSNKSSFAKWILQSEFIEN